MQMQHNFQTDRLLLAPIDLGDAEFILELVNLPDWIKFIGNKHVSSLEDAINYIRKMISNPDINYWVVRLKETQIPIGIVTFIKRYYLEHHDIGFAFLPAYRQQGYAFEATKAVLYDAKTNASHSCILATTLKDNFKSAKLLEKLGLQFEKEIQVEDENLLLFSMTTAQTEV